jgi:hypothetical protein
VTEARSQAAVATWAFLNRLQSGFNCRQDFFGISWTLQPALQQGSWLCLYPVLRRGSMMKERQFSLNRSPELAAMSA